MFLVTITLLAPLAATPAFADELAMPPPPNGMKRLGARQRLALLNGEPISTTDDASEGEDDSDEGDSEDLEALRALEEVALDPQSGGEGGVLLHAIQDLGPAHPLRVRLEDVLIDNDLREDALSDLGLITDVMAFDVGLVSDRYDIPVEMQPLVAQYIRFFQGPGRKWFRKWMGRSTRYIPVMQPILEASGVPRDLVYLSMIESGFSANALSWARASGPWQFMAPTGKEFGLAQDFWVDERRDPIKATRAAARYLAQLYKQLGHWYLAWAGYNTGGGRVKRLCERRNTKDFWVISEGRGLMKETKHYVPKLIAAALIAKNPEAFGFSDSEFEYLPLFEFDEVQIPDLTDLSVLANAAGTTEEELYDLNPELKRWCTPPVSPHKPYALRIPKGRSAQFAENFAKVPKGQRMKYVEHVVRGGDTLSVIARKHGSSPEAVMRFNGLKNARRLKLRSVLMIPVPLGAKDAVVARVERDTTTARRSGFVHRAEDEVPAGTKTSPNVAAGVATTERVGQRTRISYGVQSGDTLWAICERFKCSVENLRKWNDLPRRGKRLQIGTVLSIWQEGQLSASAFPLGSQPAKGGTSDGASPASLTTPASATSTPTTSVKPARASTPSSGAEAGEARTHELGKGETLWSVAKQYGVSVEDLKRWNAISDHKNLRAGQRLRVASP